ncbi:MAG: divalent metal cation transporter [Desulfitobacterium hafniense]|nr:divalent metal cation transporter [Desulfitobacterium hafniense]
MSINGKIINSPISFQSQNIRWFLFLTAFGPGLTVMLADTDAGSIITAAQSGAQWGYKLLLLQLLLIPILYFIQELTTRIGITTGRGHGELIKEKFGPKWAWLSVLTLFASAIGAFCRDCWCWLGVWHTTMGKRTVRCTVINLCYPRTLFTG